MIIVFKEKHRLKILFFKKNAPPQYRTQIFIFLSKILNLRKQPTIYEPLQPFY